MDACEKEDPTTDTIRTQLLLYESSNNPCVNLECVETINDVGCAVEWDIMQSSEMVTKTYKLLVRQLIARDEEDTRGSFTLSYTKANIPVNDLCIQAIDIDPEASIVNATALSATSEPESITNLCTTVIDRSAFDIFQEFLLPEQFPKPGVWYRMLIGGKLRTRVSACDTPYGNLVRVTAYSGDCVNLTCASSKFTEDDFVFEIPPRDCEAIWDATESESYYYVLVERTLERQSNNGDFDLTIEYVEERKRIGSSQNVPSKNKLKQVNLSNERANKWWQDIGISFFSKKFGSGGN